MEECEIIMKIGPKGPITCGRPGVRIGSVVKCKQHWAASRNHSEKTRRRVIRSTYDERN